MDKIIFIILGMAVVTYLPRFLPMYILTRLKIPQIVIDWLKYVPVAVLAALIVPGIITADREIFISLSNTYLLASLPAFLLALLTRSMLVTILAGMGLVVLLLQFLPSI